MTGFLVDTANTARAEGASTYPIPTIQRMNAAVALDKQPPANVAHTFLAANRLL